MKKERKATYWQVADSIEKAPVGDYLWHGYETRADFVEALRRIIGTWRNRIGRQMGERNGFVQLRFIDTPGGASDEACIPRYLLRPVQPPQTERKVKAKHGDAEIDGAFGFE